MSEDAVHETTLDNPVYVDVSPCGCDITRDKCDIACCCDQVNEGV